MSSSREQSSFMSYSSPYTSIPTDSPWQASYLPNVSADKIPCGKNTHSFLGTGSRPVYQTLEKYCQWCDTYGGMTEYSCTAAPTDRTRWACPSLADIPRRASTTFYRLLNVPQKLEELPSFHVSDQAGELEPSSEPAIPHSVTRAPQEKIVNFQGRFEIARSVPETGNGNSHQRDIEHERQVQESYTNAPVPETHSEPSCRRASPSTTLLPIMDYGYNIREMIKNCILLEDHLIHPEKRCNDCCVKHFLFLEALAEEARTLDKDNTMSPELRQAPDFFRNCQYQYYALSENPDGASDSQYNHIAQQLRNFRKLYQQRYFPMLWSSSPADTLKSPLSGACTNGLCPNS